MANFFDRFDPVNSAGAGKLPPGYFLDPQLAQDQAPKGRLYFDDIVPPAQSSGGRLNFDDIVPQAAPAQSSGRLNFDDIVPNNQSALPPGFVLDHPQGGNVFDQFNSPQGTASDIAKSGGIGVLKGIIGLAGLPGEAGNIGAQGIDAATRFVQRQLGLPESAPYDPNQPTLTGHHLPGVTSIQSHIENLTGPLYEPQTTAGKYAQSIGEFAPAIFGGPEGIGARLLGRVVAPGVASEAAGQATEGTAAEPIARIGGALLGAGAGGALESRGAGRCANV